MEWPRIKRYENRDGSWNSNAHKVSRLRQKPTNPFFLPSISIQPCSSSVLKYVTIHWLCVVLNFTGLYRCGRRWRQWNVLRCGFRHQPAERLLVDAILVSCRLRLSKQLLHVYGHDFRLWCQGMPARTSRANLVEGHYGSLKCWVGDNRLPPFQPWHWVVPLGRLLQWCHSSSWMASTSLPRIGFHRRPLR